MLQLDFTEFPLLETERLLLRQLAPADAPAVHALRSDAEVNALLGRAASAGLDDALRFVEKIAGITARREGMYWAITLKREHRFAGTICLWNFDVEAGVVETGYELLPAFRSMGIMSESLQQVLAYSFTKMAATAVIALPDAANTNSKVLLERNGFILDEGIYKSRYGHEEQLLTYVLRKEDYRPAPSALPRS